LPTHFVKRLADLTEATDLGGVEEGVEEVPVGAGNAF
jgi:hypothetical protein